MTQNLRFRPLALGTVALIAACGGGGSDAAPVIPATPAATLTAPLVGAASPVTGTRATCGLADFQAQVLQLINAHRLAGATCGARGSFAPARLLDWSGALTQAALTHSDDMMANNFFSHTGSDASGAGQRAMAAGYVWRTWGENIAANRSTATAAIAGWMASDAHCANLMNPGFRDVGLACVSGAASNDYRSYWTMVLAAP